MWESLLKHYPLSPHSNRLHAITVKMTQCGQAKLINSHSMQTVEESLLLASTAFIAMHTVFRIIGPSWLHSPVTASQSFQGNHAPPHLLSCPPISVSLPFHNGIMKTGRESLWPLNVCTGRLSAVRKGEIRDISDFLLLV